MEYPHAGKYSPRRWLARAATAVVVAAGSVIAIATPAEAAISGVRVVEFVWNAPNHSTSTGTVQCNTGEKVLGGGVLVLSLNTGVRLLESFAFSETKWWASVHNESSGPQEIRMRAICAAGVDGWEKVWSPGYSVAAGSVSDLTVACPSGKTSIAGGFQFQAPLAARTKTKASASYVSGTGWNAQIRNDSAYTFFGYVQAICTSLTGRTTASTTVSVSAGSTKATSTNCGSGKSLVGGGWSTNENTSYNIVTAALPTDSTNDYWKTNLANPDTVAHSVQHIHVCMPV